MAYTQYRVVRDHISHIAEAVQALIDDGWQPLGGPVLSYPDHTAVNQAMVKGTPDGGGGGPVNIVVDNITDASAIGKNVMKAADQAAARTAIGAGTSSLALGTTAGTAKAGNYAPAWGDVTGKPTVIAAGADQVAARAAIGAGTSNLALGTTPTTAAPGNHGHSIADITNLQTALDAKAATSALAALEARVSALETP